MKREELKAIVQNSYSQAKWIKTLQFLSGSKNLLTILLEPKAIEIKSAKAKEIVSEIVQLGALKTTDGITLPIFDVTLQDGIKIEYNRVGVNDLLKNHILKDTIKGAIVTFHYREKYNKPEWRFSFISKFGSDYFVEAESVETNPKKYTYIFGTSEEHRTALERLYNLEQSRFRLEDFFEAFNVEPVSNNFFKEYKNFYQDFVFQLSNDKTSRAIFEAEKTDDIEKDIRNFVKRLLGRLVFLYFLQKKHWLGATNKNYDDGDTNFLFNLFNYNNESKDDFYNKWLSKLFFNALNTPNRTNDGFELPDGNSVWIPFLNGGLFEENQEPKKHREIQFPPSLFELLFKFFNGYNFTIYENSPEDHTVAVDPEMLGHIFENLLEDNKDKGAFYTPKEIVHYMTQESLIEYLKTHLSHSREEIENLVKNHNTSSFSRTEIKNIENLIDNVKICDPAIGSGAFPMGLLHEISGLKALFHFELDKKPEDWKPADVKQAIIQNSIYGVDLENDAVDIARLRFWLSLVVDEPTPKPLPNLDYKIMQGNSLLENFEGIDLSNIDLFNEPTEKNITLFEEPKENCVFGDDIKKLMNDYFNPNNYEKKQKLHREIDKKVNDFIEKCLEGYENKLLIEIAGAKQSLKRKIELKQKTDVIEKDINKLENLLESKANARAKLIEYEYKQERPYFLWHLYFADVFDKGGFDIVIGNPPYVDHKKLKDISNVLKDKYTVYSGTADLSLYFFELGFNLLKEDGIFSFINTNKFFNTGYGKYLREYLNKKVIKSIVNFEQVRVFVEALVSSVIIIAINQKPKTNKFLYTEFINEDDWKKDFNLKVKSREKKYNQDLFDGREWVFVSNSELEIKNTIDSLGTPIKDIKTIVIKRGVTTGFDPAFIIPNKKAYELDCKEIIKPLLKGKEIKKYNILNSDKSLIFTRKGIDIEDYFTVRNYLLDFKKELTPRTSDAKVGRKPGNYNWFEIQDNTAYFPLFDENKIIWPLTADKWGFALDINKHYLTSGGFLLVSKQMSLNYLLALLNSKLIQYYFKFIGVMTAGGAYTLKKATIDEFPIIQKVDTTLFDFITTLIINLNEFDYNQINETVKNKHIAEFFNEVVDACVFELYFEEHMKEKEINIIDDVKRYIDKSDLTNNFENLNEEIKKQKIWELYKEMSTGIVQVKMTDFITKSPDILKPILQN